jgi:hypothetical protein
MMLQKPELKQLRAQNAAAKAVYGIHCAQQFLKQGAQLTTWTRGEKRENDTVLVCTVHRELVHRSIAGAAAHAYHASESGAHNTSRKTVLLLHGIKIHQKSLELRLRCHLQAPVTRESCCDMVAHLDLFAETSNRLRLHFLRWTSTAAFGCKRLPWSVLT